jgi:hypothetical protein
VPLICQHHLILQNDNARPHVTRICTQFLEAENVPVLPWPAHSPDMSSIEHVWDFLLFFGFISPLFNQIGQLRTSSHLQL